MFLFYFYELLTPSIAILTSAWMIESACRSMGQEVALSSCPNCVRSLTYDHAGMETSFPNVQISGTFSSPYFGAPLRLIQVPEKAEPRFHVNRVGEKSLVVCRKSKVDLFWGVGRWGVQGTLHVHVLKLACPTILVFDFRDTGVF